METFTGIGIGILIFGVMFYLLYCFFTIMDFFNEVPKQLKRIADALEKRCKNG